MSKIDRRFSISSMMDGMRRRRNGRNSGWLADVAFGAVVLLVLFQEFVFRLVREVTSAVRVTFDMPTAYARYL